MGGAPAEAEDNHLTVQEVVHQAARVVHVHTDTAEAALAVRGAAHATHQVHQHSTVHLPELVPERQARSQVPTRNRTRISCTG